MRLSQHRTLPRPQYLIYFCITLVRRINSACPARLVVASHSPPRLQLPFPAMLPKPTQQAPAFSILQLAAPSTDPLLSQFPGCGDGLDLHHYLMSSFSKGLCSTTRQGLSERADWAPATGGDLEGELLPNVFLFAFGVASLLWTLWGKRSCKIRSRNSSTICHGKSKR